MKRKWKEMKGNESKINDEKRGKENERRMNGKGDIWRSTAFHHDFQNHRRRESSPFLVEGRPPEKKQR